VPEHILSWWFHESSTCRHYDNYANESQRQFHQQLHCVGKLQQCWNDMNVYHRNINNNHQKFGLLFSINEKLLTQHTLGPITVQHWLGQGVCNFLTNHISGPFTPNTDQNLYVRDQQQIQTSQLGVYHLPALESFTVSSLVCSYS